MYHFQRTSCCCCCFPQRLCHNNLQRLCHNNLQTQNQTFSGNSRRCGGTERCYSPKVYMTCSFSSSACFVEEPVTHCRRTSLCHYRIWDEAGCKEKVWPVMTSSKMFVNQILFFFLCFFLCIPLAFLPPPPSPPPPLPAHTQPQLPISPHTPFVAPSFQQNIDFFSAFAVSGISMVLMPAHLLFSFFISGSFLLSAYA